MRGTNAAILIAFLLLLSLLAGTNAQARAQPLLPARQGQPISGTPTPGPPASAWSAVKENASAIQSLVTTAALILGLVAGYYKFIMGRVFVPRVTLNVEGALFTHRNHPAIWVKMTIKNSGLSRLITRTREDAKTNWKERARVTLNMRSFSENDIRTRPDALKNIYTWRSDYSDDVFRLHEWVEAGEIITDERIIPLSENPDAFAYALELVMETSARRWHLWPQPLFVKAVTVVSKGLSKNEQSAAGRSAAEAAQQQEGPDG